MSELLERATFDRKPRFTNVMVISARVPGHRIVGNRPAEATPVKIATVRYDISSASSYLDGPMCDRTRTQNEY